MHSKWPEIVTLVIGGGLAKAIFDWATGRRKARADVSESIAAAADESVGTARGLMAELREEVTKLRQQNQALVLEVDNLKVANGRQSEIMDRQERVIAQQAIELAELRVLVTSLQRSLGAGQDDGR